MNSPIALLSGMLIPLVWLAYQRQLPVTSTVICTTFLLFCLVLLSGACQYWCKPTPRFRIERGSLAVLFMLLSLGAMFGWIRGLSVATDAVDQQLAKPVEGVDLIIRGYVVRVSAQTPRVTQIEFAVESAKTHNHRLPRLLRLSWYSSRQQSVPTLLAGEQWQLTVRLKRFHAALSPAAFDLEGWAFRRGFGARGYIKNGQRLSATDSSESSIGNTPRRRVQEFIQNRIDDPVASGLIRALAVGDRSGLSADTWQTLRRTGTTHLMAISGLHVGLAALWGSLLVALLWRRWVGLMRRCALADLQAIAAIAAGTSYAMLAGMALPTQRAVLTLSVFALARVWRRPLSGGRVIAIALLIILALDPLAINEVGLWLSFLAVAALWLGFRSTQSVVKDAKDGTGIFRRLLAISAKWLRLQIILTVSLAPVVLTVFNQISLLSVPANLIAIPMVAFLIVPAVLFAVLVFLLGGEAIAALIFEIAARVTQALWFLLEWSANLPFATLERATPSGWTLLLAMMGISGFLLPACLPGRRWLLLAWLPLLLAPGSDLAPDEIEVAVLDVGQGLSIVVRNANQTLVYDTGIGYPGGFSAVQTVVAPYLLSRGVSRLERVLISHPDSDHAGGLDDLAARFSIERLLVGPEVNVEDSAQCSTGVRWHWPRTNFSILSPDADSDAISGNNASCVLRIDHGAVSVLLTGDIEVATEQALVRRYGNQLAADILILGHHGSRTSSTRSFLDRVQPEVGVVSAGYRNRHGHPAEEVLTRTQKLGISVERTDQSGTIVFRIKPDSYRILRYREIMRRYWHHS